MKSDIVVYASTTRTFQIAKNSCAVELTAACRTKYQRHKSDIGNRVTVA